MSSSYEVSLVLGKLIAIIERNRTSDNKDYMDHLQGGLYTLPQVINNTLSSEDALSMMSSFNSINKQITEVCEDAIQVEKRAQEKRSRFCIVG